jgi:hypothetical protein
MDFEVPGWEKCTPAGEADIRGWLIGIGLRIKEVQRFHYRCGPMISL